MQKIKLINDTKLSLCEVGEIIDTIIKNSDDGETHYFNQMDYCEVIHNERLYQVEMKYLQTYTRFYIKEKEK